MDPQLPLEILIKIACESPATFKLMLALPPVGRFIISNRRWVMRNIKGVTVTKKTQIIYELNGRVYKEGEKTLKQYNGNKSWRRNGYLHREKDKPSAELADGTKNWHRYGCLHRDNGPAVVLANGSKEWHRYGELHRSGGLPAIEWANGTRVWYRNGKRHRDGDLPAYDGIDAKSWWRKGKRHRSGGLPAIIWADGRSEYWINDARVDKNTET